MPKEKARFTELKQLPTAKEWEEYGFQKVPEELCDDNETVVPPPNGRQPAPERHKLPEGEL